MSPDPTNFEAIILYDYQCRMCRKLASIIEDHLPEHWLLESWQSYAKIRNLPLKTDKLKVLVAGEILEDQEAWEFLFINIPRLKQFTEIAGKIGIANQSISIIRRSASYIRSLCKSCR